MSLDSRTRLPPPPLPPGELNSGPNTKTSRTARCDAALLPSRKELPLALLVTAMRCRPGSSESLTIDVNFGVLLLAGGLRGSERSLRCISGTAHPRSVQRAYKVFIATCAVHAIPDERTDGVCGWLAGWLPGCLLNARPGEGYQAEACWDAFLKAACHQPKTKTDAQARADEHRK
ncbi:hypothetical protein ACG7TL_000984 [Trametes sanguinea]